MDAQTDTIDRHIPRRETDAVARAIPAVIHQTFEQVDIPARMKTAAMSWAERNPTFDYRFYDNAERRAFIAAHFEPEVAAAYDKLHYGAFRADLWRYCVLWVEGGVYADVDTLCQTDLRNIIRADDRFIVPNAGNVAHAVFNAFICAAPGHPFMKKAVDRATQLIHASADLDGYMVTGPGNLGAAMNLCLGRAEKAAHDPGSHPGGELSHRIIEKRQAADGSRHVADGDTIVFLTKYDGYLDDLDTAGVDHWADHVPSRSTSNRLQQIVKRILGRS